MIAGIEGILDYLGTDGALVKVGGLTLKVFMPSSSLANLGSLGDTVHLHTHLQVKEDGLALYGFATPEELSLFEMILTVAGAGPKTALSLLSALSSRDLSLALAAGDAQVLTQAPGVGKKMAARLILELKGKVDKALGEPVTSLVGEAEADALAALTSLGYSLKEAASALAALPRDRSLAPEEKVWLALQHLGQR